LKPVSSGRVKARRVKSPRILHPQDRRGRWQLLLLLLLVTGIAWQAWEFGLRQGGFEKERSETEIARLRAELARLETELREARSEAVRYRRQAEIEVEANGGLQAQLVVAQREKAELQSEVEMLRSLISDDNGSLYIRNLSLHSLDGAGRYGYSFTIVQVLEKVETTRGKLVMKISGKLKGKKKRLDRSEFSPDGEKVVKLEFSNYQDVSGEILLPEGFEPGSLLIEFLPRNRELKKLSRRFSWTEHLQSSGVPSATDE